MAAATLNVLTLMQGRDPSGTKIQIQGGVMGRNINGAKILFPFYSVPNPYERFCMKVPDNIKVIPIFCT